MAEHGSVLPGTLGIATALPQEAKSGWVRIFHRKGVWQGQFDLTDLGYAPGLRLAAVDIRRKSPDPFAPRGTPTVAPVRSGA
ncbi:hypothetical protein JKG68_17535 [Microvirga aerilata]|uniref:Uncharacterized protein n=1 Tax=Microvirga aerilata TaxID=670292 RepID=A0A937D0E3_9HYPH|nr:hypothetical protein [Microvirga aerilata]MBL0405766.1 hypothetical protein [Microvirga aerilata]